MSSWLQEWEAQRAVRPKQAAAKHPDERASRSLARCELAAVLSPSPSCEHAMHRHAASRGRFAASVAISIWKTVARAARQDTEKSWGGRRPSDAASPPTRCRARYGADASRIPRPQHAATTAVCPGVGIVAHCSTPMLWWGNPIKLDYPIDFVQ